jgi:hypothetical protein
MSPAVVGLDDMALTRPLPHHCFRGCFAQGEPPPLFCLLRYEPGRARLGVACESIDMAKAPKGSCVSFDVVCGSGASATSECSSSSLVHSLIASMSSMGKGSELVHHPWAHDCMSSSFVFPAASPLSLAARLISLISSIATAPAVIARVSKCCWQGTVGSTCALGLVPVTPFCAEEFPVHVVVPATVRCTTPARASAGQLLLCARELLLSSVLLTPPRNGSNRRRSMCIHLDRRLLDKTAVSAPWFASSLCVEPCSEVSAGVDAWRESLARIERRMAKPQSATPRRA